MIASVARLVRDTVRASSVVIYYPINRQFRAVDALGETRTTDAIDDNTAREVFESGHPAPMASESQDMNTRTSESPQAGTSAIPLVVGDETVGVLSLEDSPMSVGESQERLAAFLNFAALVLKSETDSDARMREVFGEMDGANTHLIEDAAQPIHMEAELRASRAQLEQMVLERTRALKMLSESNQMLMHATDEQQLLTDVCAAVVDVGGYRTAWVGFVEHDEQKSIRPVGSAGEAASYLEDLKLSWSAEPTNQGPVARCIREGRPVVARDLPNDPDHSVWVAEAINRGFRSVIGLPLFDSEGAVFGAIAICAEQPDAFRANEKKLLSELAGDLAFGIEALREKRRRVAAEEQVRDAALYTRSLIEASLDPLATVSPEGRVTDLNRATEEVLGIPRDRLIGSDFVACFTQPDEARVGFQEVLRDGFVRDLPLTFATSAGQVDVVVNASVYRDDGGFVQGVFVAAHDVTERKRAEEERLARLIHVEAIDLVNRAIQGTNDLEQMMSDVLDAVLSTLDCDRAWLFYPCNPEVDLWRVPMERSRAGFEGAFALGRDIPMDAEIADLLRIIGDSPGPVKFGPGAEHQVPPGLASAFNLQSQITLAIYPKTGEPWVFGIHQCSYPRVWTSGEERLIAEIGQRLADALTGLISERELHESEKRFRRIVDTSTEGIWVLGPDGLTTYVNARMGEMLGYSTEELVHQQMTDFMFEEDVPDHLRMMERRSQGLSESYERRFCRKDGQTVWTSVSATPVFGDEHQFEGSMGMFTDITERRLVEVALREERGLFVSGPTVVFKWKAQEGWPVEYVSPNVVDQFGYTPEELIGGGIHFAAFVHPDDLERVGAEVSAYSEQGVTSFEQIYRLAHHDGRYRWVDDFTTLLRGRDGAITHYLGYVLDITERRLVDEELAKSRALLQSVMDFSPSLIYLLDLEGRFLFANNGLAETLQMKSEEMIGKDRSQILPRTVADQHRINDLEVITTRQPAVFSEENVIAGETRFYDSLKFPLLDAEGEVYAIGGISTDVTEHRLAEEALVESEKGLKDAQRIAHLGSWELDLVNDNLVWSDEIYRMFEIDPAEFGASYEAFLNAIHPDDRESVDAAYTDSLKTGMPYAIDHRLLFPDGRIKYVHEECETTYDEEDKPNRSRGTVQDTTAHVEAEEALRIGQQRFRDIFDHSTDVIYLLEVTEDNRFRNLEVNAAYEASTGLSREQVVGKCQEEVVPKEQADIVNTKYRHCVDTGVPIDDEVLLDLPSGRRFYHSTLIPMTDDSERVTRILGISRDITESRLAEEALRASQRKLALHLEQTMLGVIEWDTDFRVREWNPAAEAIFGYTRDEAVGHHASELIVPEEARPQLDSVFERLMKQAGGEFNTNRNTTKDGRTILCEWVNTPLVDDSGAVIGVMALARDVTENRRVEELRIAKEAAEAASSAKSGFLANMSHEIRTPLNAILGFSQLLGRDQELSEIQRQWLGIINASGEHLLALINDVLDMSKIESGRTTPNLREVNLHDLLDNLHGLFNAAAAAKGLELRFICTNHVPRLVITDESKLRQVLINLLGNAVKYTDEGSIEVRVATRRTEDGNLRLVVEVEDTGTGIAPEEMNRLFEYFEQADAGRHAESGTGLGLAISRGFVRLLGGEITVRSEVGEGSVFSFDIAIGEVTEHEAAAGVRTRRVTGLQSDASRYRVLVADDAADNRELLLALLKPIGFELKAVSDGEQALEEFLSWHPNLILMDMRMPVMDGYEATRRIREAPGGAEVSIVAVTASVLSEMQDGDHVAAVDDFIGKPFSMSEIYDKIGRLLGVRYVYEDEAAPASQTEATLNPAALVALPDDLLERIRRATIAGDFDAVLRLADEVGQTDTQLAAGLRDSAERLDPEPILSALPRDADS